MEKLQSTELFPIGTGRIGYTDKIPISMWAEEDRPSDKMLLKGKAALTNAELVAILINSGNKNENAVELAHRILTKYSNNLHELGKAQAADLVRIPGLGKTKAAMIIAALEIGNRRRSQDVLNREKVSGSRDVFELFSAEMTDAVYEQFWILCLNRANRVIKKINISEGGVSGTVADPKRIFKMALDLNASSVIMCHNHPSGNVQPSEADIRLTKKLKEAGLLLDLPVLDHIIIGGENYFSFADEGMI